MLTAVFNTNGSMEMMLHSRYGLLVTKQASIVRKHGDVDLVTFKNKPQVSPELVNYQIVLFIGAFFKVWAHLPLLGRILQLKSSY